MHDTSFTEQESDKIRKQLNFAGCEIGDVIRYCPICFDQFNMVNGVSAAFDCHNKDKMLRVEKEDLICR